MVSPRTGGPGKRGARGRILIVEDDRDFADSLAEILTAERYEVKTAENGEEALAIVAEFPAQVAFVDIRLGQENGLRLIPDLKREIPRLVCLAMTAYAHLDSAIEAVQHGVYDYLRKPLDVSALLLTLRRAIEKHELENSLHLSQKIEAVGRLTGGVAHDFNNIMTVVLGHVDVLYEDVLAGTCSKEVLLEGLEEIRSAAIQASVLTRRLLLFGRHHIGAPVPLDLNVVIAGMETLLERLIRENIGIVVRTQPDLPLARVDPVQIEQVVLNLAINASDAMDEEGELTIETEYRPSGEPGSSGAAGGSYVVIRVRDTGHGMDAATVRRACEPFFTTKEPGKGTGLGLWTIRGIAKESGGDVIITSDPGLGTTVEVLFPVYDGVETVDSVEDELPAIPGGTETILLCEDDEKVREVTGALLSGRGYTVLTAGDAVEALRLVDSTGGGIDLIVTDMVMPGMSGPNLIKEIRKRIQGIRSLLISGYQPDGIDWEESLFGRSSFLQKPFEKRTLLHRVREILDRKI